MASTDDPIASPEPSPVPLPVQRDLFDIPDDIAYFNTASLAPQLKVPGDSTRPFAPPGLRL